MTNSIIDCVPVLSVIMPVYNGARTLDLAISSVLGQTFPAWELVAVVDGSTDDSYEHLLRWREKDPRIRVLRAEQNRGPGAARNEGLRHATGELVAYLDCDDEYYPDYLVQVARLRDKGDVLIFGYDYIVDREGSHELRTWDPAPHRARFFEANLTTPLGVAHRRSLAAQVGGFDESLWCQEDWDFWKRLAGTGAKILFIPFRSGLYRFRKETRSQSPKVTLDQFRAYEASRTAGVSLYGTRDRPVRRHAVQKVLFAALHSYFDSSDPAPAVATDILQVLAQSGFTCQAFCGFGSVGAEENEIRHMLDGLGLPHHFRDSTCGPYAARLAFTRKDNVAVTLLQPRSTRPGEVRTELVASFLAFFEKFLETYQPDVLLTYCDHRSLDPVIRLAKRRDIPVVVPLFDAPYDGQMAFHNVDYCLVTSEESRRRYWDERGLACIALPPTTDPVRAGPAYADFFRTVHLQPGPPFVPRPP